MTAKTGSELLEKVSAIREDLYGFKAIAIDKEINGRKLAEFVRQRNVTESEAVEFLSQKAGTMWSNYQELIPFMTVEQMSRVGWVYVFVSHVEGCLQTGSEIHGNLSKFLSLLLADLDDIAKKLKARDPKNENSRPNPKP